MKPAGSAAEVLRAFLVLGCTSFGGPVAHLGYFRRAFVERRGWLSEADYAAIVSLCQFLPGPASSQTGFCIGLRRAGWRGGLAAWAGFTLPSALLMLGIANSAAWFTHSALAGRVLHGLQLAAVAVVAQAVWGMARNLCPDLPRRLLALAAVAVLLIVSGFAGQLLVLLGGAAASYALPRPASIQAPADPAPIVTRRGAKLCMAAFFVLLVLCLPGWRGGGFALFAAFYRTGALVFGGGHVVLPLLQTAVVAPGWVTPKLFLAGYGAAQAMPGPLFTLAAFLGALCTSGPGGPAGAAIALVAIFLPGLLLVAGLLPYWHGIRRNPACAAALGGVNAAVVGLLAYALLNLVRLGAVHGLGDALIALAALAALTGLKAPPIVVVALCVAAAAV